MLPAFRHNRSESETGLVEFKNHSIVFLGRRGFVGRPGKEHDAPLAQAENFAGTFSFLIGDEVRLVQESEEATTEQERDQGIRHSFFHFRVGCA